MLLTLEHRPSDLGGCYEDVHPHPEHRSGPAGRMAALGPRRATWGG